MKISLVNPTTILRRPIGELAHLLASDGHEVSLVWSREKTDHWGAGHFDKLVDHPNIKILPIWSKEIRALIWPIPIDKDLTLKIRSILNEHDIVQTWAPFYIFTHYLLKTACLETHRAKVMVSLDTIPAYSFPFGSMIDPAMKWYLKKLSPYLQKIDLITVYSQLLIPYLEKAMPNVDLEKVMVLPTGTLFVAEKMKDLEFRTHNIDTNRPTILFIGLLNTRKGIDTVIKTAEIVSQNIPKVHFLIAGTSKQQGLWEKRAGTAMTKGTIEFLGRSQDVASLYNQADIFFLPSRGEGLPGVIMEAMAHGLPIISSNIPCIPDLVKQASNGYLCHPEKPSAFAEKIIELLSNPEQRLEMGAMSQKLIKQFSWERIYPQYTELYHRLNLATSDQTRSFSIAPFQPDDGSNF